MNSMAFQQDTPERVASALSVLDAGDRELWVRMAFSVKDALGEAGRDVWLDWSSTADNFDERAALATWKSSKAGGAVRAATLFFEARQCGWHDDARPVQVDPAEAERRRFERAERDARAAAELAAERAEAAERANAIWNGASANVADHPYVVRKGGLGFGALVRRGPWQQDGWPDALLTPIFDRDQRLMSIEAISAAGEKRSLRGGQKAGGFCAIGRFSDGAAKEVVVAEGVATAAACADATGRPAVAAFCKSNLRAAAEAVRAIRPDIAIVIAADIGAEREARQAAAAVGGYVAVPAGVEGDGADFWDVWSQRGPDECGRQLLGVLRGDPVAPEVESAPAGDVLLADFEQAMDETSAGGAGARGNEHTDAGKSLSVATVQRDQKRPVFGTPIDLFNVSEPPQVPLSVLPDSIAAYAKDQSELLGSDPSIIAMSALAAAAAVIDDGIKLQPKRMDPTWTESARLWVGVVGDPSTKKSPSISKSVRHIKRLESRLAEQNGATYGDWKYRHDQWKEAKKAAKGQDVPPEPEQPPMRRLIVEDTTVEALSEILKDNPRGVLCLQDELTGWFASMDAYKGGGGKGANKDRAHWLEIYNGGRRSIDRVTRGSIVVPNWSACMVGGIQPEMIRRIASGMGNDGLLQRFMLVVARAAQKGIDRYPDREAMDRFAALFDHLEGIAPSAQPVTMTEAAHQARERIEDLAERMSKAFDQPHLKAWLGKWEGLFARLALTYHVIECAEDGVYPNQRQVRGETAEKVERLMCGVLLHHAIYFYNEVVDANDRQSNMRQLARLILARGMTVVTKRDLHNYWRAYRRLQPWEAKGVIDGLCSLDWLHPDETSLDATDGKPKTWFVNPEVHEVFAGHAERERARREEAVAAIREIKAAYSSEQPAIEHGEARP